MAQDVRGGALGHYLAAVHGIIRGHDGAIRITTTPGEGTTVTLARAVAKASS